jgi:LIM domain kinase 1
MGLSKHSSGLYIITEFIAGGDMRHLLKDEAKDLSWKARVKMALDTAQAITYLHSKGCIHRYGNCLTVRFLSLSSCSTSSDLKSHNLLVDENQKIKVCDFGFSRQVTGNKDEPMTLCGTDEWMVCYLRQPPGH